MYYFAGFFALLAVYYLNKESIYRFVFAAASLYKGLRGRKPRKRGE